MNAFLITPEARQDLVDIWDYLANESLDAASRVMDRLEQAFDRLAEMPGMGHFREDLLGRRYRFWTVYSYVIAYRWMFRPFKLSRWFMVRDCWTHSSIADRRD